ncbi:hypothetical protein MLD52_17530 [Puniceicoccaceae bacterium K14]|nr:hypothetical protein [Puniceicoccaceae bacterium K14]
MKNVFLILLSAILTSGLFSKEKDKSPDDIIIDATIELARSYLGGSDKLDAIKSLNYQGTMLYADGNTGFADIVFQKPSFQKFEATIAEYKETSGLDDTEAWHLLENLGDETSRSLSLYGVEEILNMKASVWEYLNFYKRLEGRGKRVIYEGREFVNGNECVVLTYDHSDGIWFRRYFDVTTGRVVQTFSNKGALFVEEGEMIVDGIRFPKKLTTSFVTLEEAGSIEIVYSKIEINKKFDKAIFKLPKDY